MNNNETDYKKIAVLFSRVIYFLSNMFLINCLFAVEDGSLLYPVDDFGVFDALFCSFICILVSFFSIRFALNNNNNNTNEVIILISSVVLGAIICLPI